MSKTIRQTFNLCSQEVLSNCYSFIAEHYQQQEGNLKLMATVELIDGDKARSLSQNSLYWQWVGFLSDKLGDTREELHTRLKWQFLRPIYLRDDRGFAAWLALRSLRYSLTNNSCFSVNLGVITDNSLCKACH